MWIVSKPPPKKKTARCWEQSLPRRITQYVFNKALKPQQANTPQYQALQLLPTQTLIHNTPSVSNALLRQLCWPVVTLASLILFDGLSVFALYLNRLTHIQIYRIIHMELQCTNRPLWTLALSLRTLENFCTIALNHVFTC